MKRIWVVLVLLAGCRPAPVFQSSFDGVAVTPAYVEHGQWWQGLEGGGWPDGLPVPASEFQITVPSSYPNPWRYTQNRVVNAVQRDGKVGPVLFQAVYKPLEGSTWRPRSNYLLRPDTTFTEAYQESWVYLQPDMAENMASGNGTWRQLWEMKCKPYPGEDAENFRTSFRYYVTIQHDRINGLYWRVEGQHRPGPDNWDDYEFRYGKHVGGPDIPVPVGRWFLFQVYWKSSPSDDGRFVVRADQQVICNYTGPTMMTMHADKWNLFKCYVDPQHLEEHGYVAWQMCDDISIWADAERLE